MSRVIFPPKLAAEVVTTSFDFTSRLASTETISSASLAASVYSGNDSAPTQILQGSASISGAIVSQKVQAGVLGVIYQLICTAVTSTSQTLQLSAYLAIVPPLE